MLWRLVSRDLSSRAHLSGGVGMHFIVPMSILRHGKVLLL